MNRRDLLKGMLAAPILVALPDGKVAAYELTREPAPMYTMPKGPYEPCDYELVKAAQDLIRDARRKVGLSGLVQVNVLNLGFREASHVSDAAIVMNCDVHFRKRQGNLTKMVVVQAFELRTAKTKHGHGVKFVLVSKQDVRVYPDGLRGHCVYERDEYGNEIEQ